MKPFILDGLDFSACWNGEKHHVTIRGIRRNVYPKVGAVMVLKEQDSKRALRVRLSFIEEVELGLVIFSFHHFHRKSGAGCCKAMEEE